MSGNGLTEVDVPGEIELVHCSEPSIDGRIFLGGDDDVPTCDVDLANLPLARSFVFLQIPHCLVHSGLLHCLYLQGDDAAVSLNICQ